jgi:hypothetical protein
MSFQTAFERGSREPKQQRFRFLAHPFHWTSTTAAAPLPENISAASGLANGYYDKLFEAGIIEPSEHS